MRILRNLTVGVLRNDNIMSAYARPENVYGF